VKHISADKTRVGPVVGAGQGEGALTTLAHDGTLDVLELRASHHKNFKNEAKQKKK